MEIVPGIVAVADGVAALRDNQRQGLGDYLVVGVIAIVPGGALVGRLPDQASAQVVAIGEDLVAGISDAHQPVHGVVTVEVGRRRADLAADAVAHGIVSVGGSLGFRVVLAGEETSGIVGIMAGQPSLFDGDEPSQVVTAQLGGQVAGLDDLHEQALLGIAE
ncbi:hypothetical protein D9M70_535900 [compost metagenome]